MNVSNYVKDFSVQVSQVSPSLIPAILWEYYLRWFWNYQPNSWVARIAYTCRVVSTLMILPIVVLALLDISSYGIARTLGVIDDVKASTSDTATAIDAQGSITPQSESPFTDSENESPTEHTSHPKRRSQLSQSHTGGGSSDPLGYIGVSQPQTFYASEDNNLKLSGVGVFSPAASRPPSPTISRRGLYPEGKSTGQESDEGLHFRQRAKQEAVGA